MNHHCSEPRCRSNTETIEAELSIADYSDAPTAGMPPWAVRPLTLILTTRDGTSYLIDGVQDDTRVSLSSLDDVDKAALRVLLQQALREMEPPRLSGATTIPAWPGGIISNHASGIETSGPR